MSKKNEFSKKKNLKKMESTWPELEILGFFLDIFDPVTYECLIHPTNNENTKDIGECQNIGN